MTRVSKALSRISDAASWISLICVALMMIHVSADVTGRFLLNMPLRGTITIVSNYYMVLLGFLALAAAEDRDAHISVEVVSDMMPEGVRRALAGLARLVSAAAFALVAVRGWEVALDKTRLGASVQQGSDVIPVWPTYWAIPIGAGLMAIVAFARFFSGPGPAAEPEETWHE